MTILLGCTAFATEEEWDEIPFTDVTEDDWYYDSVYAVYNLGLLNGIDATTFAPNETMTRAMLVTVLYRIISSTNGHILDNYPSSGFKDVSLNQWYTEAVDWGVYCGIVTGVDAEHFNPMDPVTREQTATLFFRLASNYCWVDSENTRIPWDNGARDDLSDYPDADKIFPYAQEAFAWAVANKIIEGTTLENDTTPILAPSQSATRAQVSAIIVRFISYIDQL